MKRVAAYCRVSTDKSDQVNSLESQKRYFREYIMRNPEWDLVEVYVDEGITGTSTKKRRSFNKMISDAQLGRFDLIITKEISRFARNTLDSILYTRKLKDLGVGVIFMNDNINTLDQDAELRLTIMSSIAQEESRKTSDRVKWGQRRQMEAGVVFGRDMLGYDVRDGKLIINEEGAEIVRLIFHKFVHEGKGTHVIAREFREAGIRTATYMKNWSNTVILRALRNEKYCGDLVQKKTYTPNYLTHDKKRNLGEEDFVVLRDHHEPIVSRELFDAAQRELERRSPSEETKSKHSNRYCFSGKIECGKCGRKFVARRKKRPDGSLYKAWRCLEGTRHGKEKIDSAGNRIGCSGYTLNNDDLEAMMQMIMKELDFDKEKVLQVLYQIVDEVLGTKDGQDSAKRLKARKTQHEGKRQRLVDMLLDNVISQSDYEAAAKRLDAEAKAIADEESELDEKSDLQGKQAEILSGIKAKMHSLVIGESWDDAFYRKVLDRIVVQPDYRLDVYLNLLPQEWSFLLLEESKSKKKREQLVHESARQWDPWGRAKNHNCDTDVGTEELGHMEMIAAIIYQLTQNLCMEDIKKSGFDAYFVDQSTGMRLPHLLIRTSLSKSFKRVIRRGPPVRCHTRKKQHGCENGNTDRGTASDKGCRPLF